MRRTQRGTTKWFRVSPSSPRVFSLSHFRTLSVLPKSLSLHRPPSSGPGYLMKWDFHRSSHGGTDKWDRPPGQTSEGHRRTMGVRVSCHKISGRTVGYEVGRWRTGSLFNLWSPVDSPHLVAYLNPKNQRSVSLTELVEFVLCLYVNFLWPTSSLLKLLVRDPSYLYHRGL